LLLLFVVTLTKIKPLYFLASKFDIKTETISIQDLPGWLPVSRGTWPLLSAARALCRRPPAISEVGHQHAFQSETEKSKLAKKHATCKRTAKNISFCSVYF
jgi:hypothetical protein